MTLLDESPMTGLSRQIDQIRLEPDLVLPVGRLTELMELNGVSGQEPNVEGPQPALLGHPAPRSIQLLGHSFDAEIHSGRQSLPILRLLGSFWLEWPRRMHEELSAQPNEGRATRPKQRRCITIRQRSDSFNFSPFVASSTSLRGSLLSTWAKVILIP